MVIFPNLFAKILLAGAGCLAAVKLRLMEA